MSAAKLSIREATLDDLTPIHAVARSSLTLDVFSEALLAEKLFSAPRAEEFRWRTLIGEIGGSVVAFMQAVEKPAAGRAWIGLFAVAPDHRRAGHALRLFDAACASWVATPTEMELLAVPGNYFAPGLDPRYTEALCFAERAGFERWRDCVNLRGELRARFDTSRETERLEALGVRIRRASHEDSAALSAFFAATFGDDWRFEASLANRVDPPALHLALRAGSVIGFAAHSTQNREWGFFGPMGTAPDARGLGVGRVLLWHCLNDLLAAGHRSCVIPWVGPISFYMQHASCRVERVFWRYRRPAAARS